MASVLGHKFSYVIAGREEGDINIDIDIDIDIDIPATR